MNDNNIMNDNNVKEDNNIKDNNIKDNDIKDNILKKRGRKPKNYNINILKNTNIQNDENVNTEDEKIILHLLLNPNEINNESTNNLFIKNEKNNIEESETTDLYNSISNLNYINNNVSKIITHILNFNKNTKCWWCKYIFNTPAINLPENYFNNTFYCIGNFCSYNCAKSYNIDINDFITYKRNSLLNLLYFMTYSEYKNIKTAPHWLTLEDYGGILTIEQFRENFLSNTNNYLLLHPPLISRQMQIEESYKINKFKEVSIDKINKIYSELEADYTIKRTKPIDSSYLNLENTMGINRKNKVIKK
jgi:hypothetical protein